MKKYNEIEKKAFDNFVLEAKQNVVVRQLTPKKSNEHLSFHVQRSKNQFLSPQPRNWNASDLMNDTTNSVLSQNQQSTKFPIEGNQHVKS